MGKVERIEAEVRTLSAEELTAFRKWFREFDADAWDREIESDALPGKLEVLPTSKHLAELPDVLGSLPRLPKTEAEEFAQDVVSAKSELAAMKVRDSWAS